jgi:hypothetical protein
MPPFKTPGRDFTAAELEDMRYYETQRGVHVGWRGPKWLRRIGCLFVGHAWEQGFPGDGDRYCPQCGTVD